MTKTVLIGCGNSGRKIAAELSNFGADIVGFCDLSIDRAEELAKKYGGEAYSDYRKMIAEKTPDAAFVCTPPYCTDEILMCAVHSGISFMTETPVTRQGGKGKDIAEKIRENGITAAVYSELYYSRLMRVIRGFCKKYQVVQADAEIITTPPAEFWKRDGDLSGGILTEKGTDILWTALNLFGEIKNVSAVSSRGFVTGIADYSTDDCFSAVITFSKNTILNLTLGSYGTADDGLKLRLYAYGKRLELSGGEIKVYGETFDPGKTKKMLHAGEEIPDEVCADCLVYRNDDITPARAFINALESGKTDSLESYEDGLRVTELVREINSKTVRV